MFSFTSVKYQTVSFGFREISKHFLSCSFNQRKKGSHFFNNNNNLCCLKLFSHASHTISPRSESHVVCDWVKSQAMFAMWRAALMGFTAAYARGATRKAKKLGYCSRSIEEGKSLLLHELNSVLGGGVGRAALLESYWVWRLSLWQASFLVH